jgi:DNA polymerase-3 subunit epsilon
MRGFETLGCFPTGRHYPGIAHLIRIVVVGLADEYTSETSVTELDLVAIDTETTGRDPEVDRIVEIACVRYRGGVVIERKSWLVNPGRPIPQEASDVHGITDDAVKDATSFAGVVAELLVAIKGAVPVAYNAEYDRKVLHAELARENLSFEDPPPALRRNIEWIDPLVWAREIQKNEKSRALSEVAERLGVALEGAHRAANDAEATLHVLSHFLREPRVPKTYGAFVQEQRRLARLFDDERKAWRGR